MRWPSSSPPSSCGAAESVYTWDTAKSLVYHSGGNSYRPENILPELISLLSYRPASLVELIR